MESACKPAGSSAGSVGVVTGDPALEAAAAIDEAQLMENMADCRDILAEAGAIFLEDVGNMLAALEAAVVSRDARTTERAAHLIKGAFMSLAAPAATRMASSIERSARSGEQATLDSVRALGEEVERVRTALRRIMKAR